jgi:hypothetical protein
LNEHHLQITEINSCELRFIFSMNVREIEALIQKHMNHNQALLLCVTMTTETAIALEEQNDHQKV